METLDHLEQGRLLITNAVIHTLLKECTKRKDLAAGRRLSLFMTNSGLNSDTFLCDHLIRMFAACGQLSDANQAFTNVPKPSIYTWNAILSAHANLGARARALEMYYEMRQKGFEPDGVTFLCTLKVCCDMRVTWQGMVIHDHIIKNGLNLDSTIGNAVLDMYCKSGILDEAQKVFDDLKKRTLVSWGALMAGYVQHGHGIHTLQLFRRMHHEGVKPNLIIFSSALKACNNTGDLMQGKLIHDWIIRTGLQSDLVVENTLIDMYAKCGSIEEARKVFCGLSSRDVVSWGALIAGYALYGPCHLAFKLFHDMQKDGVQPCKATFLSILKACEVTGRCREIHNQIIKSRYELDIVIGNTIVAMYAKCGSLEESHRVFDRLQDRNVVSWGALIAGYAAQGLCHAAMQLFQEMQHKGIAVSDPILTCILKICGDEGDITYGRLVNCLVIEHGIQSESVEDMLPEMYARCGSFEDAQKVMKFVDRDVDLWASILTGFSQHGYFDCALRFFDMMQKQGIKPNNVIYSCILKVCSSTLNIQKGRLIHDDVIWAGIESDMVIGNTLVDLYAKSGSLEEACKVFSAMPKRDSVSWGTLITGYVEHGDNVSALESFEKLQLQGIKPNEATLLSALKACGSLGAFEQGRLIHDQIIRNGMQLDVAIGSTLLDMYAKCGRLHEAHTVFDGLPHQDIVAWGALVAGYTWNGCSESVLRVMKDMQVHCLKPDEVIFTNALAACSHKGLVQEGYFYFKSLTEEHGMTPSAEQFSCMIDLLGRSGNLVEAEDLLLTVPSLPDGVAWLSLLTSCKTYGNMMQGKRML